MEVLALTIFLSLVLATLFLTFFFWAARRPGGGSLEQDSLMPLRDDSTRHNRQSADLSTES